MGLSSHTDSSWRYDISVRDGKGFVKGDDEVSVSDEENINISTSMFEDSIHNKMKIII